MSDSGDAPSKELTFYLCAAYSPAESHVKEYEDGRSEGYEIVCMDGSFHVHEYCFYNSEFLYQMFKGLDNYIQIQCIWKVASKMLFYRID